MFQVLEQGLDRHARAAEDWCSVHHLGVMTDWFVHSSSVDPSAIFQRPANGAVHRIPPVKSAYRKVPIPSFPERSTQESE